MNITFAHFLQTGSPDGASMNCDNLDYTRSTGLLFQSGGATATPNDHGNHITKYLEGRDISRMTWV